MKKLLVVSALLLGASLVNAEDAMDRSDVLERIKPVGMVNVEGMSVKAAAAPAAMQEKAPMVTEAPAAAIDGKASYQTACFACHGTGAVGAPIVGNAGHWAGRIAKGDTVLLDHAINGFNAMPPKGGQMQLSDDVIKAIVDHMVAESK